MMLEQQKKTASASDEPRSGRCSGDASSRPSFVLVHGTWHGGWCWDEVAQVLRSAGHKVYAPTLPGMAGTDAGVDAGVDLTAHTQAVLNVIDHNDLQDFVLVGHSYGGMVISGVADKCAARIRTVVYLDALLPRDGESVASLLPVERWLALEAAAIRYGNGLVIPPPDARYFGVPDELAERITPRLTGQPIASFQQSIRLLKGGALCVRRRVYIGCDVPAMDTFERIKLALRADPDWEYRSLATGHEAMFSRPGDVARLLLEAAVSG